MKSIVVITVAATLLTNATNTSSVGGPLTELFIAILGMWAVGFYQIWSHRLGLLGSIGSIIFSFIGGVVGLVIGGQIMQTTLSIVHFEERLQGQTHPLLYILAAGMAILSILGSWWAIQIVVWMRDRRNAAQINT